jgi:hypothetical protein
MLELFLQRGWGLCAGPNGRQLFYGKESGIPKAFRGVFVSNEDSDPRRALELGFEALNNPASVMSAKE